VSHRPVGSTTTPITAPGVPFYAKKARCRQEVVWFEPIYTLTLSAMLPDKDGALQSHLRGTVVLSRSSFETQDVTDFVKLLNSRPSDEGTVNRAWQKVVARADSHVLSRDFSSLVPEDRIMVGRSAAPAVFVDYAEQYYVNAKVPLAGSANLDAKVADDGSLSELSSQVESKTFETVVGALPISSVITGELGLSGGKNLANAGEIEAFQLTVSVSGYRHTLAKLVDFPTGSIPCPIAKDIAFADATEYKREDISAVAEATQQQKNESTSKETTTNSQNGKSNQEKKP
jgi:hypothetical protein